MTAASRCWLSQSPDGDFFDPEIWLAHGLGQFQMASQSPDGDFFDPEQKSTKTRFY